MAPTALQVALEPGGGAKPAESKQETPETELKQPLRTRESDATHRSWEEFLCSYFYPKSRADQRYCPPQYKLPLETRFLIAGVPDPEVTSVPATFDVMVETLIRAAAFHNWRYDRYWVPWSSGKRGSSTASAADPIQANNEPGLLLFRRVDSVLVVFLAGETPTSGVNKTAFVNAAEFILARAPKQRLSVLAPRFSGSVDSYKVALENLEKNPSYTGASFISGSATRFDNRTDFEQVSTPEKLVTYEATVENDARATEMFLGWLGTRGITRGEVAILAEAGTAFGAAQGNRSDKVLTIEFPYQISRLRNAYEQDPELRALWMGRSKESRQQRLDWSMRTEREGTDRLPSFNGPQTALGQEREIEQIMDAIRRRGIRAAAISSTDLLDTVFLALMLQRYSPGVRVFILDSDLLFLYSSSSLSFHGMLMVSPYPQWLENQRLLHWSDEKSRRLATFTNRSAEAVFNAFTMLLTGFPAIEYGSPALTQSSKPPMWVTAVGRGEVWPIALLTEDAKLPASSLAASPEPLERRDPPPADPHWSYFALLIVFIGITGYGAWIYLRRRLNTLFPARDFDRASFFLFEAPEDSTARTVFLQAICLFGATALLPFYLGGLAAAHSGSPVWVWAAGAAVAACLAVFVHVTVRSPQALKGLCSAGVLILMVSGPWLFWARLAFGPANSHTLERFFFSYRLLNPLSGVSVLPGFVLPWFACCWWAVAKFNQLRTREVRSPRLDSWPTSEPILAGLGPALQAACRNAEDIVHGSVAVPFAVWMLSLYWVFPATGLAGLEAESGVLSWTTGVQTAFLLTSLFIVLTAWQMFQTFKGLEGVLKGLVDHPLGEAMGRLPRDLGASHLWLRGDNRFPFHSCLQGMQRLRSLHHAGFAGAPDSLTLAGMEGKLKCLLDLCAQGKRLPRTEVDGLHRSFNQATGAMYPQLARIWKGESKGDEVSAKAEEFVALRIAALVRYLVMQMRSMLEYLSMAVFLLIVSIVSYPFEPHQNLVYWAAGMAISCGIVTVWAVSGLDSHPVLAPLNAKSHGGGSVDLIRKLVFYGGAPAIAALGALFPGSARSLQVLIEQLPKLLGG